MNQTINHEPLTSILFNYKLMKLKYLFATLLLCVSLSTFAQQLTETEKYVFDELVYNRREVGEYMVIHKWVTPIRYKIYGEVDQSLLTEIDSTFSQLKQLTQLDIQKTEDDAEVNFIFVIGKKDTHMLSANMHKYLNTYGGSQYKTTKQFAISRIENVVMPENYRFKIEVRHTIKKHIVRSLGFFKASEVAPNSLFYTKNNNKLKIDQFDSHIISTLYLPSIKPGMTKEEVDLLLKN